MRQIRAVLCGYYGQGNGGDEALLATLLQMLPKYVSPVVLSGNPEETQQRYGVESCNRKSAIQVLQAIRNSDVFIWGGGSLIQDATSALSPLYYAGLMGLAQQMNLKTIAWAQGIGPLRRELTRRVARQSFGGCTAVSVRDRGSAELLTEWKIPFMMAPDPVWALDSKPVKGLWEMRAPRVAVTLRSHSTLTPQRLSHLTQALISFQRATQTCILLVPFQDQDLSIAQTIATQLTGPHQIIRIADPRELKGLFQGVEMAIGMRYHSLIMAAAAECRCFALSYDPKVSQLMRELDIPGWELAINLPDNPNLISQTWLKYYVNGDRLSNDQIQSLRDRALMHQDLLAET